VLIIPMIFKDKPAYFILGLAFGFLFTIIFERIFVLPLFSLELFMNSFMLSFLIFSLRKPALELFTALSKVVRGSMIVFILLPKLFCFSSILA